MGTGDSGTTFELSTDIQTAETLVVGFSEFGLAGLTAVDYLTEQLSMVEAGYLAGSGPPFITPFENGVPRHNTRLYVDKKTSVAVLISERFVPVPAAREFATTVADLCEEGEFDNITLLSGIPVAHGPDDHVPFYIATQDYNERFLTDTEIRPMGTGFLDGVPAELVRHGMETDDVAVGVFTTPVHQQAPDAAAAIRLVNALSETHDLTIDTGPLEQFAATVEAQYRALADRIAAADEESMPDDRMYM